MTKIFILFCSVILCLVSANVETDILTNDIILPDIVNNLTEVELVSTSNLPYVYHDIGEKKVVSIVVNPIIHNIAHGYGTGGSFGDKPVESTTSSPVTTTNPPDQLLADVISVYFRKTKFILRFMLNGAAAFVRGIIRFIICTFIPLCGLFGVFGDEEIDASSLTPEGVTRGLDLLEGIIETYHSIQNTTLL